ncbi:MAG: DUF4115 domain-containing protein [Alphaproteobacteria bacterium]|nr:DUF4115 domain-containing protein [Alphaproteobacteria bacterium]
MEDNKTEEIITEMTAGEMLRNARTTGRRKREIPTIAKQLCIREEFLQALEDGNYTFIPELVYILGFARNYAMELGLNPDEIVAKIKEELGVVSDIATDDDDKKSLPKAQKNKNSTTATSILKRALSYVKKHWMWFAGGVAILLVIIAAIVFAVSGGASESDMPETDTVVVATVNEPAFKVSVRERWGKENSKKSQVILQALRDSWIKIEDARGRTEFSRVLVKGDIYYVPADGKFRATFGDAGAIDIWVNGKLAAKAGPDHERKSDISLAVDKLVPAEAKSDDKADAKSDTKSE